MSRLTRDGTAEPILRDQILRHARGQGNVNFPCSADHEQDWHLTRLIHTLLYVMTIHTYIHTLFSTSILYNFINFHARVLYKHRIHGKLGFQLSLLHYL